MSERQKDSPRTQHSRIVPLVPYRLTYIPDRRIVSKRKVPDISGAAGCYVKEIHDPLNHLHVIRYHYPADKSRFMSTTTSRPGEHVTTATKGRCVVKTEEGNLYVRLDFEQVDNTFYYKGKTMEPDELMEVIWDQSGRNQIYFNRVLLCNDTLRKMSELQQANSASMF